LSTVATKSAGSIDGEYLPWTGASVEADEDVVVVEEEPDEPHPAARAPASASAIRIVPLASFDVGRLAMLASSLGSCCRRCSAER
jgi:hypothetical protein